MGVIYLYLLLASLFFLFRLCLGLLYSSALFHVTTVVSRPNNHNNYKSTRTRTAIRMMYRPKENSKKFLLAIFLCTCEHIPMLTERLFLASPLACTMSFASLVFRVVGLFNTSPREASTSCLYFPLSMR